MTDKNLGNLNFNSQINYNYLLTINVIFNI